MAPYKKPLITLFAAISVLINCSYNTKDSLHANRAALSAPADLFDDRTEKVVYLEQNWDMTDSLWFYNTTQGSNLIEYDLFLHIEQAENRQAFRANDNMRKYRYLAQMPSRQNPDALPVGFVKDHYEGVDYMGFTCAACHTGQLNYQGVGMRIDGGPALSDLLSFQYGLLDALEATIADEEKLKRLANKIYANDDVETLKLLSARLEKRYQSQKVYLDTNTPTNGNDFIHYGYGRQDAFGAIYNRLLHAATQDDPFNRNPSNAPVNYPALWDTPQHDFVQWNGIGDNYKAGALGRNVGEVLGVFGSVDLQKHEDDKGLRSSVDVSNLVKLETRLKSLWSPKWPEHILPKIDRDLAQQGHQVFLDYKCHECHEDIDRTDPKRLITAQMASLDLVETDPMMAVNAMIGTGKAGIFKGMDYPYKEDGSKIQPITPVLPLVQILSEEVVLQPDRSRPPLLRTLDRYWDIYYSIKSNDVTNNIRQVNFEGEEDPTKYLKAYKARPLNGIWATAPYLHNGSVPTLYSLFLPSCTEREIEQGKACRPNSFTLGSREFDPINVGLEQRDKTHYPNIFTLNTQLPGNSNKGHEYAVGRSRLIKLDKNNKPLRQADGSYVTYRLPPINENQRLALVEYLKTL